MESDDRDLLTTTALVVVVVLLALGAGCGAGGDHAAASTNKPPPNASLGALLVGRLYGNAATGCVWVGGKTDGAQVAWPAKYRVRTGPTRIETPGGRVLAREGDWLRLAGGFDPATKANPKCPSAGEKGKWLPGKIEFLGRHRPPEVRKP